MVQKCPMHRLNMPFDDEYHASPDAPYALYTSLHQAGPVHRICLPDQSPAWIVTRYQDVYAGLRDMRLARPREYAGPHFTTTRFPEGLPTGTLLTTDPPEQTRLKRLVNFSFLPKKVETFRPRVHELVDGLLDAFEERGGGDVVDDFACRLPITIVSDVLGIPEAYRAQVKQWADTAFGGDDEAAAGIVAEMFRFLDEIVRDKMKDPGPDLISYWISAKDEDDNPALSDSEIRSLTGATLIGGYDTTAAMIGRGTLALLDDPDTTAWLRASPDQFDEAVEELLRMYTSVHHGFRRFATEDLVIGGTKIAKGDTVLLHLAASGRDPERFEDPDTFKIDRADRRHTTFGGGPHFCTGAELARMEVTIALRTLFTRFPGLALAVPRAELRLRPSAWVPGLIHLPVTV